jgi:hypothetical protein
MAIHRLLQGAVFDDRAVKAMTTAYDAALTELGLLDRTDHITEIIARKIIECAQSGERDPERLLELALKDMPGQDTHRPRWRGAKTGE